MISEIKQVHRFQSCLYKMQIDGHWTEGIAKLDKDCGFGDHNILFILDKDGNKVNNVFDYSLNNISFYNFNVSIELNEG